VEKVRAWPATLAPPGAAGGRALEEVDQDDEEDSLATGAGAGAAATGAGADGAAPTPVPGPGIVPQAASMAAPMAPPAHRAGAVRSG
jgi:hypothetical protein